MSAPKGNPRPTRSRYNSPFGHLPAASALEPPKHSAENQGARTMLDRWVEPSLAPPRPSFAEAGFERVGTMVGMAPLGTLPTAKVIKNSVAKDVAGRGALVKRGTPTVSTPGESATATATPEPTTAPSRPSSSSAKGGGSTPAPVSTPLQRASPTIEAEVVLIPQPAPPPRISVPPSQSLSTNTTVTTPTFTTSHMTYSTPHTPQDQTSPATYRPRNVPQPTIEQQKMGQHVFALQPYVPPPVSRREPSLPQQYVQYVPKPVIVPQGGDYLDKDFTDKIVESAVQDAIDDKRWCTAYALRTLYDQHRKNDRMVRLIDAVFSENANEEQIALFKNVMGFRKKHGKKTGFASEKYFNVEDETPAPEAHSSVKNGDGSTFSTPAGKSDSGARSMSDSQARQSSFALATVTAPPHKEHNHEHVSKKHKGNHFPSSTSEMNGDAGAGAENGEQITASSQRPQSQGLQNGDSSHQRSDSMSSLSSVDEQDFDGVDLTGSRDSSRIPQANAALTQAHHRPPYANGQNPASAETLAGLGARNQPAPIRVPAARGPKTFVFSTVTTLSSSSANKSSNAANASQRPKSSTHDKSMSPAALLPAASIPSPTTKEPSCGLLKSKKDLNKASVRPAVADENDSTVSLKRKARQVTERNTSKIESFERGRKRRHHSIPLLPEPAFDSASDGESIAPPVVAKKQSIKLRLAPSTKKKSTRQTAINYDSDGLSSPTNLDFVPEPPGSLSVSRAGTPNMLNRPTRKGKTGSGLRVKTSPMKKKGGGTLAGMPRASGERNSPIGNGAPQDENDDSCAACGGNGELVCCDGCTRSFHFKCVDPPMNEDALPDSWYCDPCHGKVEPPPRTSEDGKIFDQLLSKNWTKLPSAYRLPKDIREYFEGVKTGAEGEYEEPAPPKTAKNRGGYAQDEAPDYFKLRDGKGKVVLCHRCHGAASAPDRGIIPCTYCGLYWHMDCLDVPMAKEPLPSRPWRCPAHVDDLLAILPTNLGPAHRRRKIKGASAIKPVLSRGLKNFGDIEIENESTDDEDEVGFFEQKEYGRVYKLPERGIKLDFIAQVRRKTGGGFAPPRLPQQTPAAPASAPERASPAFDQRSLQECQAALNLASLCVPATTSGDVTPLVDALLSQASPEVIALMSQGDAENIQQGTMSDSERTSLLAMQAHIARMLAGGSPPQAEQVATPASTAAEKMKDEPMSSVDEDTDMML